MAKEAKRQDINQRILKLSEKLKVQQARETTLKDALNNLARVRETISAEVLVTKQKSENLKEVLKEFQSELAKLTQSSGGDPKAAQSKLAWLTITPADVPRQPSARSKS